MASFQIPPPPPMQSKGNTEINWQNFEEAWTDYCIATELDKKDAKIQVATLKTVMGQDCRTVLSGLKLSADDMKDVNQILSSLRDHFVMKRNVLYERYMFHSAEQQPQETVTQFMERLRKLASTCKFGDQRMEEEMIRDRLVMGCRDQGARTRLFREDECSLKKAFDTLKISEATTMQLKVITGNDQPPQEVNFAKPKRVTGRHPTNQSTTSKQQYNKQQRQNYTPKGYTNRCYYCGGKHNPGRNNCPAYGKECSRCKKMNHFTKVCMARTENLHAGEQEQCDAETAEMSGSDESNFSLEVDDEYVGILKGQKGRKIMVPVEMKVKKNNQTQIVQCQVDTGATCNVMSYKELCKLDGTNKPRLHPSTVRIKMYDGNYIPVKGERDLKCAYDGNSYLLNFKIVETTNEVPLLSGESSIKMGVIQIGCKDETLHFTQSRDLINEYKDVFEGLGCLPGEYKLTIDETVTPVKHAARRVPINVKRELKKKLTELEQRGIIDNVSEPTDWISSMVIVKKPHKLRICVDPRDLNQAIKRPHYPIPVIDDILPNLAKAKVFTVLDAKDGFWQVKLDEASSYLTTFATPFGRFRWKRMPFGISSAPEEFQRRQHEIIEGLHGVEVIADDFLVFGSGDTMAEAVADHDRNLEKFLERARKVNLKLNKAKLKLRQTTVTYMGHKLTSDGLSPDPEKVRAVVDMAPPEDKKAVQRLLGSVTYLAKFLPKLSEVAEPLRRLTDADTHFEWLEHHTAALNEIKHLLTQAPVLKYFDEAAETTIQCDASEKGLGATLLQHGQPVTFASRALSHTEQCYAQIEKECLAIVFACERFDHYIQGRKVTVETDHKPLVPIFTKAIHGAPKRLQRMLLRLQKYQLVVTYKPGKEVLIADWLSRAYLPDTGRLDKIYQDIEEINQMDLLKVSAATEHQLRCGTSADQQLQDLMLMVQQGWPESKEDVPGSIREYFNYRDEITAQNGILFKGQKVIVPQALRSRMVEKVHSSHLGVEACIRRARDTLFWPGMSAVIKEKVEQCTTCNSMKPKQQKETLMSTEIPTRPWKTVAQDLFHVNNMDYMVTVDYYSDFWEIDQLDSTTAQDIVECTKRHFARHGIPERVITDNGPQFVAQDYAKFAAEWDFQHVTSSPRYSQSNGKAESAVKIAKTLLKKALKEGSDVYLAMLEWRNTPDPDGVSAVQKLMSRRTRTCLPTPEVLLMPKVVPNVPEQIRLRKQQAKLQYDKGAKDLPELNIGQGVLLQPDLLHQPWRRAVCRQILGDRSYVVETADGRQYRRNRRFLREGPNTAHEAPSTGRTRKDLLQPEDRQQCSRPEPVAAERRSSQPSGAKQSEAPAQQSLPPTSTEGRPQRQRKMPAKFQDFVLTK